MTVKILLEVEDNIAEATQVNNKYMLLVCKKCKQYENSTTSM
jgi:hypothetical protein